MQSDFRKIVHSAKKTMHICLDPCPGLLLLALLLGLLGQDASLFSVIIIFLLTARRGRRAFFALLATPGIGCTRKLHEADAEAKSVEATVAVALPGAQQWLILLRFEQPAYAGNCLVSSIK